MRLWPMLDGWLASFMLGTDPLFPILGRNTQLKHLFVIPLVRRACGQVQQSLVQRGNTERALQNVAYV